MIGELRECRGCGGRQFAEVINLGTQYVVAFPKVKVPGALAAPLRVVRCEHCSLVQLAHTVKKEELFETFWYRSGISETMRVALDEIVRRVNSIVELNPKDQVLDIGSNDGTLLQMYPSHVTTVGIDPCQELVFESSREKRVDVAIAGFFSKKKLDEFNAGPFKVITAVAMFYDVEDPRGFLEDCRDLLTDDGLLVIQMNYLKTMLEETTVDNISHEHLTYWSVNTLSRIVESVGMKLAGVETNNVNGGSFRCYITRPGVGLRGLSIDKQMQLYGKKAALTLAEQKMGLDGTGVYSYFRRRVGEKREALRDYILGIKKKNPGSKWYVYGASTRGTALMQYLDLPEGTFMGAAERDERKYGRMMVGSWVPIVPEAEFRAHATHALVLPYHFREQIELREAQWMALGGTMIFPLPLPCVVHEGEERQLEIGHAVMAD